MDVIVDSCVWVQFFNSKSPKLRELLKKDQACTNEVVLMELVPTLRLSRSASSIGLLGGVKIISLSIDWKNLQEIRIKNLQNGINNVGIPDLLILQQALQNGLPIYSLDKHFKLMQPFFEFDLIEG